MRSNRCHSLELRSPWPCVVRARAKKAGGSIRLYCGTWTLHVQYCTLVLPDHWPSAGFSFVSIRSWYFPPAPAMWKGTLLPLQ